MSDLIGAELKWGEPCKHDETRICMRCSLERFEARLHEASGDELERVQRAIEALSFAIHGDTDTRKEGQ